MTAIHLQGVTVHLGSTPVLDEIDLEIDQGELVGVVGPSGAGKTTLLRLLLGEVQPSTGTCRRGESSGRSSGVGYVPQLDAGERDFPLTAEGAVLLGSAASSRRIPWFSRHERSAARAALERLDVGDLAGRGLHELSGGQYQRVLLARALVGQPDTLLLDEPTSGIDLATRADMLGLVAELRRQGLTIVLTTHDLNWVAGHLPRIVCLNRSITADGAPASALTAETVQATFGAAMRVIEHQGRPIVVDQHGLVDDR